MELNLRDNAAAITVADAVFTNAFNEPLIHQVVTAYLAGARAGTRAQKTRSFVSGGRSKPWRQKGTGRARAGTIRSPLWRGGGIIFAAQPADYSQKVNKKMYRGAMRSILSELLRQKRLQVVESFSIEMPKTKALVERLRALELSNVLIVTADFDEKLFLAGRNLIGVEVLEVASVDPVSLVKAQQVLITVPALRTLEESLA